ncbi:hypothetical protein PI124_g17728 [Phytophthora idaei]|nr:hypothetical protein PI125_g18688 [Phytophthora idaei]KAG3137674.1 hypothetical protein PI126_g17278 [Phytophthora idaei]KAG3237275.1 hypothetical protein PI124_g17728 [Phytophthora idaei]
MRLDIVEHAWPDPTPDVTAWNNAVLRTLEHLNWRMSLENRDDAWIAELKPKMMQVALAGGLTTVSISSGFLMSL